MSGVSHELLFQGTLPPRKGKIVTDVLSRKWHAIFSTLIIRKWLAKQPRFCNIVVDRVFLTQVKTAQERHKETAKS